ncbi:hypothetical protein [Streptomyces sp. NPDC050164]|uniref:hypothetical protein n=1 Tax=Streptomyces sp. NPDC050164 TaxID=3365605 RepID=UPI00379279FE
MSAAWEFLVEHAGADRHFHIPGAVSETHGIVMAGLSGPSLVAIFASLDDVRRDAAAGRGTQAIAHHLHKRIDDRLKPDRDGDGDGERQ